MLCYAAAPLSLYPVYVGMRSSSRILPPTYSQTVILTHQRFDDVGLAHTCNVHGGGALRILGDQVAARNDELNDEGCVAVEARVVQRTPPAAVPRRRLRIDAPAQQLAGFLRGARRDEIAQEIAAFRHRRVALLHKRALRELPLRLVRDPHRFHHLLV